MNDKPGHGDVGWWTMLVVGTVVLFLNALVYQSMTWAPSRALGDPVTPMWPYWSAFALSWAALSLLLRFASKQTGKPNESGAVWCVLFIALVMRVVVCGTSPVLSDDIWRYIHDGGMLGQGTNPYLVAPDELSADQLPVPQIVDRMNNPALVTIYQPTSQYVFVGLDRLWAMSPESFRRWDPDHDRLFRYGFVLFDMALIGLLLWQLRQMGRSAWWATAYAWHPLAISEVAGAGHQDVIGIALLLLALCLASRLIRPGPPGADVDQPLAASRDRWIAIGAGVAFGLALGVKPVVLPIALILVWVLRRRPSHVVMAAVSTVLTGAAIYLPFVLMDGGMAGMADTARVFIDKWAFNGSVYHLAVRWAFEKSTVDMLAAGVLLVVIVVSLARSRGDAARSAGTFLFASLLVSSTVHPWYLLWALALLPLCFNLPLWVFSLTIATSYVAHINPEGYRVPGSVAVFEYVPVYGLLAAGAVVWLWRLKVKTPG